MPATARSARRLRRPCRIPDSGFSVLLFDYRGYGRNPGRPSEAGLLMDARAARACLAHRGDIAPAHLVYFGESLGAAVAIALAAEQAPTS